MQLSPSQPFVGSRRSKLRSPHAYTPVRLFRLPLLSFLGSTPTFPFLLSFLFLTFFDLSFFHNNRWWIPSEFQVDFEPEFTNDTPQRHFETESSYSLAEVETTE
jgi:hypothetical protein